MACGRLTSLFADYDVKVTRATLIAEHSGHHKHFALAFQTIIVFFLLLLSASKEIALGEMWVKVNVQPAAAKRSANERLLLPSCSLEHLSCLSGIQGSLTLRQLDN